MNGDKNIHTKSENNNILDIEGVKKKTTLKKTLIYGLIKKGKFPRSIRLSDKRVGWIESQIDAWISAKLNSAK